MAAIATSIKTSLSTFTKNHPEPVVFVGNLAFQATIHALGKVIFGSQRTNLRGVLILSAIFPLGRLLVNSSLNEREYRTETVNRKKKRVYTTNWSAVATWLISLVALAAIGYLVYHKGRYAIQVPSPVSKLGCIQSIGVPWFFCMINGI